MNCFLALVMLLHGLGCGVPRDPRKTLQGAREGVMCLDAMVIAFEGRLPEDEELRSESKT